MPDLKIKECDGEALRTQAGRADGAATGSASKVLQANLRCAMKPSGAGGAAAATGRGATSLLRAACRQGLRNHFGEVPGATDLRPQRVQQIPLICGATKWPVLVGVCLAAFSVCSAVSKAGSTRSGRSTKAAVELHSCDSIAAIRPAAAKA